MVPVIFILLEAVIKNYLKLVKKVNTLSFYLNISSHLIHNGEIIQRYTPLYTFILTEY